jgi:hypothetical protein
MLLGEQFHEIWEVNDKSDEDRHLPIYGFDDDILSEPIMDHTILVDHHIDVKTESTTEPTTKTDGVKEPPMNYNDFEEDRGKDDISTRTTSRVELNKNERGNNSYDNNSYDKECINLCDERTEESDRGIEINRGIETEDEINYKNDNNQILQTINNFATEFVKSVCKPQYDLMNKYSVKNDIQGWN